MTAVMSKMIDPPLQLVAAERACVADIMTADVVSVRDELALDQLVALFVERDLSRAPVIDVSGRPIGMVSKTDVVVEQHRRDTQEGELGRTVRDVMTPVAFTVHTATTIGNAARRMLRDHLHAVPVIGAAGQLIGMLSATDIVAWVAGVRP
jgi:CBS domain-containing protein